MSNRELNAMAAWYQNFTQGHNRLYLRHRNATEAVAELVEHGYTAAALECFERLPDANRAEISGLVFGMRPENHYRHWSVKQWVQRANELLPVDSEKWNLRQAKMPHWFLQIQLEVLTHGVENAEFEACAYLLEINNHFRTH